MATALSCVDSNSHRFSSVTGPAIRKLSLSEFRNYKRLKLELSREPIVLTGENGALMKKQSDLCIEIPSKDTPRIQEGHRIVIHIICQLVEEFFKNKKLL